MRSETRNYIYVYDEKNQKIIVINGETGEEIAEKEDEVTSLLGYLNTCNEIQKLRKFAVWCAHKTNKRLKPIQAKMLDLAEKAIYNEAEVEELKQLYEETEGTAVATDSAGLQYGSARAPAFLASRECINPDPYQGARKAARYHRLWADLKEQEKVKEQENSYLKEIGANPSEKSVRKTEQKQIDCLLDLLNG